MVRKFPDTLEKLSEWETEQHERGWLVVTPIQEKQGTAVNCHCPYHETRGVFSGIFGEYRDVGADCLRNKEDAASTR